jgi:uncharacterized membrane protein YqgA involved in biofilm formation
MAQTINKTVLNQIILLQENLDTLAERLQKNESLSKEYEQYQEFKADYSTIGQLYAASACLEQIIESQQ